MLGLELGQGSWMGAAVAAGTEAHTGSVVGLLEREVPRSRRVGRKTSKATLCPAATPTPHPVSLMSAPNLLQGMLGKGENENGGKCAGQTEPGKKKDSTKPPTQLPRWWWWLSKPAHRMALG